MTTEEIKDTLTSLENLMYGFNYQVSFGADTFQDCKTLDEFYHQLKLKYNDIKPEKTQPILLNETDLWEEIDLVLSFVVIVQPV